MKSEKFENFNVPLIKVLCKTKTTVYVNAFFVSYSSDGCNADIET